MIMKKNTKFGLIISSAVIVGILLLVIPQSETDPLNTSLEKNPVVINTLERNFGTIYASIGSPVMGSLDAPVTIMAFSDYQCPGCKDWFLNTNPASFKSLFPPLVFDNIQVASTTENSAIVVVTTNKAVDCTVEYGTNEQFTNTASDSDMMNMLHTEHLVTITDLEPSTIYDLVLL